MHSGASPTADSRVRNLAILGSTGSIGRSTLEVVAAHPNRFRVVTLTGGSNLPLLAEQVRHFRPRQVAVIDDRQARRLRESLGKDCPEVVSGAEGYIACAAHAECDLVVSAIVGAAGLVPTMAAIEAGRDVALANKETLVCAGPLVMEAVARKGVRLFPVDSEHSAIFQSLSGQRKADVKRLILTASGGPLRHLPSVDLDQVTVGEALAHPNWAMGRKISIDSATMMNKGLEVIEARWLFDLPLDRIDVLIHPESIVHSMVEYTDGSVIAQLGVPDMKGPIAYALSYPERLPLDLPPLDLAALGRLSFDRPDRERFACLGLAYRAQERGGTAPAVLNAANEVAVGAFLEGRIRFSGIPATVGRVLDQHEPLPIRKLDEVLRADRWARDRAARLIESLPSPEVPC